MIPICGLQFNRNQGKYRMLLGISSYEISPMATPSRQEKCHPIKTLFIGGHIEAI